METLPFREAVRHELKIFAKTINVTAIGRGAHATQSNQVALGDNFVESVKLGDKVLLRLHEWAIGLPRVTTAERNSMSTVGMLGGEAVYDATASKVSVYSSGQWKYLAYEA